MKRAASPRPDHTGLRLLFGALGALPALALAAATVPDAGAPAQPVASTEAVTLIAELSPSTEYCATLAGAPWPRNADARRALLHRMEIVRTICIGHAGYLAALGALWLELGEPAQALLWLERSLMLQPDNLGAQADHALALAALGEPAARDALAAQWMLRTDVPPALRARLTREVAIAAQSSNAVQPSVQLPANTVDGWVFYREVSLLGGYESNLDHSPRLNEITLTLPDGSLELPLDSPLRPRKGAALVADFSWQLAHSPRPGAIVQTGLQAGTRYAPDDEGTNWHYLQWAANASQQWGQWRGQFQAGASLVGGRDSEAYRLLRMGLAIDREAIGCNHRAVLEAETRHHETTTRADGRTVGGLWSSQCPWPGNNGWTWGVAGRASIDQPINADRVGGTQRQTSLGLRLAGGLSHRVRLDASLRASRVADSEGYSPLLENNAIRVLHQTQLSVELARPIEQPWLVGADAVVQFQAIRQSSNLAIFRYNGVSLYSGVRWRW